MDDGSLIAPLVDVFRHGGGLILLGVLFLWTAGFFAPVAGNARLRGFTDELALYIGLGLLIMGLGQAALYYGGSTDEAPPTPPAVATATPGRQTLGDPGAPALVRWAPGVPADPPTRPGAGEAARPHVD